jgi:cyclophilin family peptidyl-prolyl cis-trans isomerase
MARRRRAGDSKKMSKHERRTRSKMKQIEREEDDFEPELKSTRKARLADSRKRRNDLMVMSVAIIFIFSVLGGYLYYDNYLKPGDENGNGSYTPPIPKTNGDIYDIPNFEVSDPQNPVIIMELKNYGSVVIELYMNMAPITAKNFYDLTIQGRYNGNIFHRVIKDFMIQGGDFTNRDGTGGHAAEFHPGFGDQDDPNSWKIPDEFHPNLRNNRKTLSMANSGPNTGGSQFFINVVDNNYLDNKHAVFGEVIGGMDLIDEIAEMPEEEKQEDRPIIDVTMSKVKEYIQ